MKGYDAFAGVIVGRQDAPRGQDGHPQRRPSGHRRVHQQVEEEKKAWALIDASSGGSFTIRLLVGVLPELEQQRAGHRRLHAVGARRQHGHQGGA
jgi:hypothetical protein